MVITDNVPWGIGAIKMEQDIAVAQEKNRKI
jgi:hypothetical protein